MKRKIITVSQWIEIFPLGYFNQVIIDLKTLGK